MNYRKSVAAVGVVGAAIALGACGQSDSSSTSATEETKALTIATTSNNKTAMEAVIEAYKKKTGLDINLTVADTAQYQTTLRTQLSSGTAPDVFTVWAGSGNPGAINVLQKAGYLADLSDRSWVGDVEPGTAETLKVKDKTYGLPSKLDAVGTIYNVKTLEGLGLKAPTTYTEMLQYCKDVKAKGKVAFALGIQTDWVAQLIPYALVASTVYAKAPDFNDQLASDKATFAGSGWTEAFDKYLEMNEAGCFNDQPLGTDVTASYNLVNTGTAVGVVQVLASFPQITSTAPAGTEFGFFPLPGDDDASKNPIPRGIGVSFAVNDGAKNKKNGLEFVDWLASAEGTKAWFDAAPGIPAVKGATVTANPVNQAAIDIIEAGNTAPFPDQSWPNAKVQAAHLKGVQQMFSGQATGEQVLKSMDEAFGA
ncbi:carbohydrate ABC transporter substrate-binding protein, CUT1 family [Micromonospora pallida]|uniref:Carbohydrate ABC transporter substrate-binding protein, CUT1 family n=1 Tax=Micromonospora pallida TaxID=145854 RepID=A0A1C6SFQ2_9ACTN|nr:extracellular solute-binding protein [Micromonospora pallida]SCL28285.1 carbohydrate ABC transporter substrate-binding protein, CUT1 family [Micromonospora pallida]